MRGSGCYWYVGRDGRIEEVPMPQPEWYYACGCNDTTIQFDCEAGCMRELQRREAARLDMETRETGKHAIPRR